jgi:hypothetical protein
MVLILDESFTFSVEELALGQRALCLEVRLKGSSSSIVRKSFSKELEFSNVLVSYFFSVLLYHGSLFGSSVGWHFFFLGIYRGGVFLGSILLGRSLLRYWLLIR